MALTADVEVRGVDEVLALLESMPAHLFKEAKKQISKSTLKVQSDILDPLQFGVNGIQSRTGALARSMRTSITGTELKNISGKVFTDSIYAPIHEVGGTINAKNAYKNVPGGPYLNIPGRDNKTPSGIMRESPRVVFATGGYIVKSKAPNGKYVVIKDGKLMFILVKSVTIPANLNMVETAVNEVPTLLSNLNQSLLEGLELS